MKKKWIFLVLLFLPMIGFAQTNVEKIISNYQDYKGVESITITPKAFSAFFGDDAKEDGLFSKIDRLKILIVDGKDHDTKTYVMTELKTELKLFEEAMKIKEEDEEITFYVKEKELLLITSSGDEFVLLYVLGTIDEALMNSIMNGEISFR